MDMDPGVTNMNERRSYLTSVGRIRMSRKSAKELGKNIRVVQNFSPEQIGSVVKVGQESIYRKIYAEIKALS